MTTRRKFGSFASPTPAESTANTVAQVAKAAPALYSVGGGALGALLGSTVLPVLGTSAGAAAGSALGGLLGQGISATVGGAAEQKANQLAEARNQDVLEEQAKASALDSLLGKYRTFL